MSDKRLKQLFLMGEINPPIISGYKSYDADTTEGRYPVLSGFC